MRLLAVRTAVRALPFIPIEHDKLYPPDQSCSSTIEWIANTGKDMHARLIKVDAQVTVQNLLPKTIHKSVRRQFINDQTCVCPATFVASIPRGRVTKRGLVITPDGQLLEDVSIFFQNAGRTMASHVSLEWSLEQLELDGRVAALSTDGALLYYHWLFQLLPRYELMRRAGIDLNEIDYYVISSRRHAFQRESMALLGVDPNKIIESDRVPRIRARELIVPSVPLGVSCYRPWMIEFLRSVFLQKKMQNVGPSGRRLYISRAGAGYRRVRNESDVIEFLHHRGFETIAMEALSVQQQAAAMESCDVVVAPHGGGLSNIAFCSPGTKIIEIFSPELVASYFWKISNQVGLDYYYLLGKGRPATLDSDYPQSWGAATDIEVDLKTLQQTLALAGIA
jgi:capsular polysaccharide biosynthesis protein